jgi:hypothetical protein
MKSLEQIKREGKAIRELCKLLREQPFETKELRIQGESDESVGLISDEIVIRSRFGNSLQFDTKEDFNNFRAKLREAFEYCIDGPFIETIEEINLRLNQ